MNKTEIKDVLKKYGYAVIAPSWYFGEPEEQSVLFNAYDKQGTCYTFFVDWGKRNALRCMLSSIMVHDTYDVTYMFFKEVRA